MSDTLERDTVIELLEKLGSDRDEDVLEAARALHTQIAEAGVHWQDLLVGDDDATPEDTADTPLDDDNVDTEEEEDEDEDMAVLEPVSNFTGDEAQTPELIDKLLARQGNSEAFREELEDYKSDLASGDFTPSDHNYIQALYQRLSKSN